jgi:enoyl-CoA hydratase/carnithine racemase
MSTNHFPVLRLNIHGSTGTLILNRPDKRNALSRQLLAETRQALDDLHQQRSVRAVIITGAGPAFCAGMDLGEMLATSKHPDALAQWNQDAQVYRDLMELMLRFPKPLIAAVNGPALAGGAGLMLACDIVVAAEEATFGLPEPLRGLVAGVVAPLLAFRAGAGASGYLLTTSAVIDATRARELGVFHEVVKADHLWPRAVELAEQCARGAPESLQLTKKMLNETIGESLLTALSAGAAISATARTTEAAAEGLQAFLEKREPKWK